MLYSQMERELSEGQPWCPWQQTNLSEVRSHLAEPDQRTVEICNEVLHTHLERSRINQSSCAGVNQTKSNNLYQLIYYYWCLLVAER